MSTVAEIKAALPKLSEAELGQVEALLAEVRQKHLMELVELERSNGFESFEARPGRVMTIADVDLLIADEGL